MSPRVDVVVVNFNSGSHLQVCLASLDAGLAGLEWTAVVVDNASVDGSESLAVVFAPRVRLVRNAENAGFSKAVNQGVRCLNGEWVLLLNPDCRLQPHVVAVMLDALAPDAACAVVGPMVLDEDGATQGSARGDPAMLTGLFGRSTWLTRTFPQSRFARRNIRTADVISPDLTPVEVEWVSGACMLIRRAALEKIGGFDERYFLYWEDADLCRRLRRAGYCVRYAPRARVVHTAGQSSRTVRSLATRAFHQSAYTYYATHVAPHRPMRRLVARMLLTARCWWKLKRMGREPVVEPAAATIERRTP